MGRFQKHLFICTNQRKPDDARGCCASRGSIDLAGYAKKRIHEMGLKGKVRINKAGCLDACAQGPSMVVYPDDVWYRPRTEEDIERILQDHVVNDKTVDSLIIPFKSTPSSA